MESRTISLELTMDIVAEYLIAKLRTARGNVAYLTLRGLSKFSKKKFGSTIAGYRLHYARIAFDVIADDVVYHVYDDGNGKRRTKMLAYIVTKENPIFKIARTGDTDEMKRYIMKMVTKTSKS